MGKVLRLPEGKLLLLTHLAYGCSKGDAVTEYRSWIMHSPHLADSPSLLN